jgi:hypothetical protein
MRNWLSGPRILGAHHSVPSKFAEDLPHTESIGCKASEREGDCVSSCKVANAAS